MKLRLVPTFSAGGKSALGMPVAGMHSLVAGMSGSGKSTTLRALLAGAAFEPDVALVAVDPKRGVEFAGWGPRATAIARTPEESAGVLEAAVQLMFDRYDRLAETGVTEWDVTPDDPAVLVVVDELAELLDNGDRVLEDRCGRALRSLLRMGRAAGVSVAAATQRPSAEAIPTDIRDSFGYRVAHALLSVEAVRMVFGAVAEQAPCHTLPIGPDHAGRCFILRDGERAPINAWTLYVPPEQVPVIASQTADLRPRLELPTTPVSGPQRGAWQPPRPTLGDEVDQAVLAALANGPRPYSDVADELGATADAIRKRLVRLEQTGKVAHAAGSAVWALVAS